MSQSLSRCGVVTNKKMYVEVSQRDSRQTFDHDHYDFKGQLGADEGKEMSAVVRTCSQAITNWSSWHIGADPRAKRGVRPVFVSYNRNNGNAGKPGFEIGVWVKAPGALLRRSGAIIPRKILRLYLQNPAFWRSSTLWQWELPSYAFCQLFNNGNGVSTRSPSKLVLGPSVAHPLLFVLSPSLLVSFLASSILPSHSLPCPCGSTENAKPELGGSNKQRPKCTGGKWRTNSKYWKMQDRKVQDQKLQDRKKQDQKMQDLKLKDHFTGLVNAGPEKRGPKRERVETEGPQSLI